MAFLSGWGYRVPITIDQTKIDADLTHFAVPIFLGTAVGISDADMSAIFDEVGSSSKKIAVTKSDGTTEIYVEIEQWDSGNEKALLWVSKSDLVIDDAVDTVLYLYFDSAHADNTTYVGDIGARTEVWDSYSKAVWHLSENGNGSAGEFIDSTSNNHDGQGGGGTGSQVPVQDTNTVLGAGQTFDGLVASGGGDYIAVADSADWNIGTADFTVMFMAYVVNTTANQGFISTRNTPAEGGWGIDTQSSNRLRHSGVTSSNNMLTTGEWHIYFFVRSSGTLYFYRDITAYGSGALGTKNQGTGLAIGRLYSNFDRYYLENNAKLTEMRFISTARSSAWMKAEYYAQNDTLVTFGSIETNTESATLDDTLTLNDNWNLQIDPDNQSISDILTLNDSWELLTDPETVELNETFNLSDNWSLQLNPDNQSLDDTLTLADSWNVSIDENIDYPSKIISYNPLIFVTDTDPAKIIEVDITDPTSPIKTSHIITGCKNAKDVILNDTNDYFYVLCAEGKVVKIEKADLSNQTVINTGETNLLQLSESLDDYFRLFVGTDDSDGELVMIDEAEIKKINTDFRFIKQVISKISTRLNTIIGKLINTDFRFIASISNKIKSDLRWLKHAYAQVNYNGIDYSDWKVKINTVDLVPLNDVNMKSIQITHNVDQEYDGSVATFVLNRRHDKLDYDNLNNSSQITNQNAVEILINNASEFTGKIAELKVNSEQETVTVTAYGTKPSSLTNNISISLPSVNEQIHLYHCLVNDVNISNPYVNINDKSPKYYKGIKVSLGEQIEQRILRLSSFGNTTTLAQQIEAGTFIPKQNWTYFWLALAENFVTKVKWLSLRYLGTSLSSMSTDTWKINGVAYNYQKQYDDVLTLLGDGTVIASDFDDTGISNTSAIISALQSASYIDGSGNILTAFKELQSFSELDIEYTNNEKALIYDVVKNQLGYYLGSAPYKEVSVTNGKKITKERWEDRKDGLYNIKDEGYDYENYAKIVAGIEYEKIKTINETIIPLTSATIEISLDAYYYYNVHLLSRINVTNTTTANIYNNLNGFPVAVKTITISSDSMKVSLQCDNQKSQEELEVLDATYPDEKDDAYFFEAEESKIYSKFDPNKWEYPT